LHSGGTRVKEKKNEQSKSKREYNMSRKD